jgi:hypothetical protein
MDMHAMSEALEQVPGLWSRGPCTEPLPAQEAGALREHVAALLAEHGITMREAAISWVAALCRLAWLVTSGSDRATRAGALSQRSVG